MSLFAHIRPRVGTAVALSVLSASVIVAAVRSDGYHATNVDLNDGVVWVYNETRGWVSRVNTQTAEAESGFSVDGLLDLEQDDSTIYALTSAGLARFDPATGTGFFNEKWPTNSVVGTGGGVGAMLDRGSGSVWVSQGISVGNWKESLEPTVKVSPSAQLVVSPSGSAVVVDPTTDEYTVVTLDETGSPVFGNPISFGADIPADLAADDLTVVGDRPVVLVDDGVLLPGGRLVASPVGASMELQLPSGSSSTVVVAGDLGLAEIDLGSGDVTSIAESPSASAARPIRHGSCISAAWSSPGNFQQFCNGSLTGSRDIPDFTQESPLQFRLNGVALVLAGVGDEQWVVRDGDLIPVTSWDQADPKLLNQEEQEDPTPAETEDETERTCDDSPVAPVAKPVPFEYGAKPNSTVVIDIISNFDDANCDPLAAVDVSTSADEEGQPSRAVAINFGQSIQFRAPADEGAVVVRFTISDGTPGNEQASELTVNVKSGSSSKPELKNPDRRPKTAVQQSKSVSYNILADWTDRDGDLLSLVSASVASPADGRVVFGADGLITYTAETTTGVKTIVVRVQDEAGNTNEGQLEVVVQPPGPIPPVARDDYAAGRVDQAVTIVPTLNDTDANTDPGEKAGDLTATILREGLPAGLSRVDGPDSAGVVTLSASVEGTYVIRYTLSDGTGKTSDASIRFDAVAADSANLPPVAVRDSVVIREGRTANVDVLSNDADPNGDVMAVTDATISPVTLANDGTARVVVIDRRYVRVEVFKRPATPTFTVNYRITDGLSDPVEGQLLVTVPSTVGNQYPITQTDEASVRVNEVVSIAVLANDRDPDGDQLFIVPESVKLDPGSPGLVWLDGTTVRYKAGPDAQDAKVVVRYEVEDDPTFSGLQRVAGNALIRVIGTAGPNNPPVPLPGELRVFTGAKATFRVPLGGIDPDGDTVVLSAVTQQGTLGTAEQVGDTIVYTAGVVAGADQFAYTVTDRQGLEGTGLVRVVVAAGDPHPPVPINDTLRVRPGRVVSVNVLANDTDPDGDEIRLLDTVRALDLAVTATANETRVDVQLPAEAGTFVLTYEVNDERSQQPQQATITIIADPLAPLLAPVTRDDPDPEKSPLVKRTIQDATGADVVVAEIAVLGNDDDPDGSPSDLVASVVPMQAGVTDAKDLAPLGPESIRVVMTDYTQWVVYQATDLDGRASSAVAKIAANVNERPECPAQDLPVATAVIPGDAVRIEISDLVTDPEGDTVQLEGQAPTVTPDDGAILTEEGDYSGFGYQPNELTQLTSVTVAVQVEDRPGTENNNVVTCFMTIAIKRENEAPVVKDASFQVEQQVTKVQSLANLREAGFVVDADAEDTLSFVQTGAADQNGVKLQISPSGDVSVTADKAPVGATLKFTYTVTDGNSSSGEPKAGTIVVKIVSTTRPPPAVQTFTLTDVKQGAPVTQDVSIGAFDPFAPDNPMKYTVDSSPSEGAGSISNNESVVTFTPAADFFGRAVVRFTATDQVGRTSSGTVTYTVIGKPKPPGQPIVTEVSSHRAVISWAPADPQGAPITDYVVRWTGGEKSAGTATSVTIDGLPNGTAVQFSVVARNKVGDSAPSGLSGSVVPDQIPPKPIAPVVSTFGDKSLTVTWAEVVPDGTPIIRYDLYVSAGGAPRQLGPTARSFEWNTGLTNGTPYTFSIVAVNSAGASERSDASNSLSPATNPSQPTSVVATDVGSAIEARVRLTWTNGADNGRPISGYRIFDNGSPVPGGFSTDPTKPVEFALTPGNHSFTVVSINAVGDSPASPASAVGTFAVAPGSPILTPPASDQDRQITLVFTAPANTGGCPIVKYQYFMGSSWTDLAADRVIRGLTNGTGYAVMIRAVNCKFPGSNSAAYTAIPSGPPILANITASGSASGQSITWTWNATGAYNGRPLTYSVTGAGLNSGAGSGSQNLTYGYSSTQSINVHVCDNIGRCVDKGVTVSTPPPPQPYIVTSRGGPCTIGSCVVIQGANFTPNAPLRVLCEGNPTTFNFRTTLSDGSFPPTQSVCYHSNVNQLITVIDVATGRQVSAVSPSW